MIPLDPEIERKLTFQSYQSQPAIDGVRYQPLVKHQALEGSFMELLRLTDGEVEGLPCPFTPRQLSLAQAVPGRINAFHLHPKEQQNEIWCVAQGMLLVWLIDVRPDSPTRGHRRKVILHSEAPGLLLIPSGVAHGYKAGAAGALLIYATDTQFNLADPNEGRLPWDSFGAALWEDDRG